jgi:hypothetical protein
MRGAHKINNLKPLSTVLVAEIGAIRDFLFLMLDSSDFLLHLLHEGSKNKKNKVGNKIVFSL